jgi:hypothetical protein
MNEGERNGRKKEEKGKEERRMKGENEGSEE